MIYRQLFDRMAPLKTVSAGVIGTGDFSTAIMAQSTLMPRLNVSVAADLEVARVERAYRQAGFAAERLAVCETRAAPLHALEQGQRVILTDPLLMMDLPVDVIVEATGDAEAGATHALSAIRHGKHVSMVNKEADAVVGPILKHAVDREGVVYTAADGDQHGLLIGLVSWARELGLEVLCAGKATDGTIVFRREDGSLEHRGRNVPLDADGRRVFGSAGREHLEQRAAILGDAARPEVNDYEETVIVANATGLAPDVEELHHPVVRTAEIPGVLCPQEDGGVLRSRGAIDMAVELRDAHATPMAGGVFVVVASAREYSRRFLVGKGHASNGRGTASLLYRPYHLCGVEATMSVLCAALLGLPTGATDYRPRFDVVGRVSRRMKPGRVLGDEDVEARILPAASVSPGSPLPLRMAIGRPLARSVEAGDLISAGTITAPVDSALWSLRAEQDEHFLSGV